VRRSIGSTTTSPACRSAMAEASRGVLGGFELGTDASAVRHPDRYADKRGTKMWREVTSLIKQITIVKEKRCNERRV